MSMKRDSCCDMRGMLSFLILFMLNKKPMHGQQITDELAKRKGTRPSPGTVYPALKALKEAGFLKETKHGKNIVYSLTPDGKKALHTAKEQFCRTFMDVM